MADWKDLVVDWLPGIEQESRITVFTNSKMATYARLLAEVESVPFPSAFFRKLLCFYVHERVDDETHKAILESIEE